MVIEVQPTPSVPTGPELDAFRQSLHGELITPDSPEYGEARKIFNAMIDRRPGLIARCADTHDVVQTVNFARDNNLLVSVRGGGHSVAGHAVCDGGLVIDLSLMKKIEVDPENRIASVQPGVRLGEFITETEKYGLVSPTGTASDTGIAGLTLGGGYGWLVGKYGMAVDNVVGAEVVTADGRVLRANADENSDLYWAIRGGSSNFGVVTLFEMRLHPLSQVLGGMLIHPFDRARDVLRYYREVTSSIPDELSVFTALLTDPEGHKAIAIALCYAGDIEEGEKVIAPIRAFGPPLADLIKPMPYSEMNTLIDAALPPGLQQYWKWNGVRELTDDAIDTIVEHFARVPSPRSIILIEHLHGAAARVAPAATAFPHRDAPYTLVTLSLWEDPADSEPHIAWSRSLSAATEPVSTGGVYVNGVTDKDEKAQATYGVNYDRLAMIKRKYDPMNLFRHNQNIKPAKA
jgi:FAD/FMN-containing dehydrogenase